MEENKKLTGRDLDAEIAEKIFGWKLISVGKDFNGENQGEILYPPNQTPDQEFYNFLPRIGKIHRGCATNAYHEDLLDAIIVAKHVKLTLDIKDMPTNPEELSRMALEHWEFVNKELLLQIG